MSRGKIVHVMQPTEHRSWLADRLAFRPGITATYIRDHYPALVQDNFDHFLDGLIKAGIPG